MPTQEELMAYWKQEATENAQRFVEGADLDTSKIASEIIKALGLIARAGDRMDMQPGSSSRYGLDCYIAALDDWLRCASGAVHTHLKRGARDEAQRFASAMDFEPDAIARTIADQKFLIATCGDFASLRPSSRSRYWLECYLIALEIILEKQKVAV